NARSLRGGTLLMTPLKGADGQIYALAQGNLVIPGVKAGAAGSSVQVNITTAGRIPGGATVERSVASELAGDRTIRLELKRASFSTVARAVGAINGAYGQGTATALNSRVIVLHTPMTSSAKVRFLAGIQNVVINEAAPNPRVVINSRTGSV